MNNEQWTNFAKKISSQFYTEIILKKKKSFKIVSL